jgi:hypothetical protein
MSKDGTFTQDAIVLNELERAFSVLFKVESPRAFGTAKRPRQGFSDGCEGVQWNTGIDRARDVLTLGANLEGMAYDGWPIARLIERELASPRLIEVAGMPEVAECELWFTRDAWQAAARLPIEEQYLTPAVPQLLGTLDDQSWRNVLRGALTCLDERRNHRGRKRVEVTLSASGEKVTKAVSPHLQIKCVLAASTTASGAEIMSALTLARDTLTPIYHWMVEQSRP